jgi:hypothetical protein
MDMQYRGRFAAVAIPAGVTAKGKLKVSVCFTPRLKQATEGDTTKGDRNLVSQATAASNFAEMMEKLIEDGMGLGKDPSPKFELELAGKRVVQFTCDKQWQAIWNQDGGKELRRKVWLSLLSGAQIRAWMDSGAATHVQPATGNSAQVARSGNSTVETPGLFGLAAKIQDRYQEIALGLARAEVSPGPQARAELEQAQIKFKDVARDYEVHLDRIAGHGSIREAPVKTSPPNGGSGDSNPTKTGFSDEDTFHPIFSKLHPHPRLRQLLGLLVELELPDDGSLTTGTLRILENEPYWLESGANEWLSTPFLISRKGKRAEYFALRERTTFQSLKRLAPLTFDALALAMQSLAALRTDESSRSSEGRLSAPPPVRGAGISLVKVDGHATDVVKAFTQAPGEIPTDSLLVGYAVEVTPSSSARRNRSGADDFWLSLCKRQSIFEIKKSAEEENALRLWWRRSPRRVSAKSEVWVEHEDENQVKGPIPADAVADDIVPLSISLSRTPQPITGVVLGTLGTQPELIVATSIGDWRVAPSPSRKEDFDTFSKLAGEYRFSGELKKTGDSDFKLLADDYERIGDARTGQLLKDLDAAQQDVERFWLRCKIGEKLYLEPLLIGQGRPAPTSDGDPDSFGQILGKALTRTKVRDEIAKKRSVVARGARTVFHKSGQNDPLQVRVVRVIEVIKQGKLHEIRVSREDVGNFSLWAEAGKVKIHGLSPTAPEKPGDDPEAIPQHGQSWLEIVSYTTSNPPLIDSAWVLTDVGSLMVETVRRDRVVFSQTADWQIEHTAWKSEKSDAAKLHLVSKLNPTMAALAPLTLSDWAAVTNELNPGDHVNARGRQYKDKFEPVWLERQAASEPWVAGVPVAVKAADEQTFKFQALGSLSSVDTYNRCLEWLQKSQNEVEFEPNDFAIVPRLGQLIWLKPAASGIVASFRIANRPDSANHGKTSFWGRIVQDPNGVKATFLATSLGFIQVSNEGASIQITAIPTGVTARVEVALGEGGAAELKEFKLAGALYRDGDSGEDRYCRPLAPKDEKFLKVALADATVPLGAVMMVSGSESAVRANLVATLLEDPGDTPTVRTQIRAWALKQYFEPLGQPVEMDVDLAGFDAECRKSLRRGTTVALSNPEIRFRIASPKDVLVRDANYDGWIVDRSAGPNWFTVRVYRTEDTQCYRFDLIGRPAQISHGESNNVSVSDYDICTLGFKLTTRNSPDTDVPNQIKRLPQEDQMFVSDVSFTWRHWGLVSPNPILKYGADEPGAEQYRPQGAAIVCTGDPPPRSLVRGRFGVMFDVRMRSVDLAGKISEHDNSSSPANLPEPVRRIHVLRHDAMGAPAVAEVIRDNLLVQEALLPVAFESTGKEEGKSADIILKSTWQPDNGWQIVEKAEKGQWLVFPPPAGLDLLLGHGVFDKDPDAGFAALQEIHTAAKNATREGFRYRTDSGVMPYPRDPLARRLAVLVAGSVRSPEQTGREALMMCEFIGTWPRVKAVLITAQDARGNKVVVKRRGQGLLIEVPPGEVCEVAVSAAPIEEDVKLLALTSWLNPSNTPEANHALEVIGRGRHPLVSGVHRVRILHAVDRPSRPAVIESMVKTGARPIGSQALNLSCKITYDPMTTGNISLHAKWDEYVDNPKFRFPSVPVHEARRCFDPFIENMGQDEMNSILDTIIAWRDDPYAPEWGLHYAVRHPEQISRYEADPWFWEAMRHFTTPSVGTATLLSRPFSRPEPGELPKPVNFDFVHTFDDTRHRWVRYQANAYTCFSREFPNGPAVASKESTKVEVESSTRPVVPDVAYVVPLFGHDPGAGPYLEADKERIRKGNALRIYLRRPWYSTGEGEQLGVVFSSAERPRRNLREKVTEWGYDPGWYGPTDPGTFLPHPRKEWCLWRTNDFSCVLPGPRKQDEPEWKVDVAAHDVRFSPTRGLWYADVLFDELFPLPAHTLKGRPYLPFIRLALARYQDRSLEGAQLSEIVTLDFIQLQPSRSLVVKWTARGSLYCRVSGVRPEAPEDATSRRVEVMIQKPFNNNEPAFAEIVRQGSWQELHPSREEGAFCYAGEVSLPTPSASGFELIVRECELIDTAEQPRVYRILYADRGLIKS